MPLSILAGWPARRWLVAAVLVPALGALLVAVAGPAHVRSPVWWALLGLAAVAGAGVLASYVPRAGRRPEVGCTPCATVAGLTVVAALLAVDGAGADVAGPAMAAAATLFGLVQRLNQPEACPAPGRPRDPSAD